MGFIVPLCLQMQSTIREHRDGGNAGGIFNRYNVIRVSLQVEEQIHIVKDITHCPKLKCRSLHYNL